MSVARSSPSSVAACCRCCLTNRRATIVEVIASPRSPAISCICTRAASSCSTLVPKQYGRTGGFNVSMPYMACRTLILITTGTEDGTGMPCKCLASALVVCQSSVSMPQPSLSSFSSALVVCQSSVSMPQPSLSSFWMAVLISALPQNLGIEGWGLRISFSFLFIV